MWDKDKSFYAAGGWRGMIAGGGWAIARGIWARAGAGVLPPEGIDQVVEVFLQEAVDDGQRVFIGSRIKI